MVLIATTALPLEEPALLLPALLLPQPQLLLLLPAALALLLEALFLSPCHAPLALLRVANATLHSLAAADLLVPLLALLAWPTSPLSSAELNRATFAFKRDHYAKEN